MNAAVCSGHERATRKSQVAVADDRWQDHEADCGLEPHASIAATVSDRAHNDLPVAVTNGVAVFPNPNTVCR